MKDLTFLIKLLMTWRPHVIMIRLSTLTTPIFSEFHGHTPFIPVGVLLRAINRFELLGNGASLSDNRSTVICISFSLYAMLTTIYTTESFLGVNVTSSCYVQTSNWCASYYYGFEIHVITLILVSILLTLFMINQLATFHPNGEAACSGCDDALQNIHCVLVAVLLFTFLHCTTWKWIMDVQL